MPKVLIADEVSPECIDTLRQFAGVEAEYRPGMKKEELLAVIGGYEALIVRSATKVTAEVLGAAKALRAIARAGVGVDNIDCEAATRRGVVVMNTPEGNTIAAAELTVAMMLALARRIPEAHATVEAGKWERSKFMGVEVHGKVLGVVGMGKIGKEVAKMAQGMGMEVVAYDPFLSAAQAAAMKVTPLELDEVLRRSDFVTVHVPLTEQTRGLIGEKRLGLCKDGVRFINCARGGIIDEAALAAGLKSGKVGGAAIDVFVTEPPAGSPLLGLPNVVLTPHLGASTREAQELVGIQSARLIGRFLTSGEIKNAVNMIDIDPALALQLAPYRKLAEKIGRLHSQLLQGKVAKISIDCAGEALEAPQTRRLLGIAALRGLLQGWLDAPVNDVNANHFAREHGINIVESTSLIPEGFTSLLSVTVETDAGTRKIAGTLFGRATPKIVFIDNYLCDAVPEGSMLIFANDDTPGIIGRVGTLLGQAKVNIANIFLGRDKAGGTALALFTLDTPLPPAVLSALSSSPGILWARSVHL